MFENVQTLSAFVFQDASPRCIPPRGGSHKLKSLWMSHILENPGAIRMFGNITQGVLSLLKVSSDRVANKITHDFDLRNNILSFTSKNQSGIPTNYSTTFWPVARVVSSAITEHAQRPVRRHNAEPVTKRVRVVKL
jgi:hypothetical protein